MVKINKKINLLVQTNKQNTKNYFEINLPKINPNNA